MDLISVIVPVYNVEKYLDQCIESIVNQTYKNLEIILVDDGSLDNSSVLCDTWAQIDSRIKVLHLVNGGAGKARNCGLEISHGDWISFIDSDDYIHLNMYESLLSFCDATVDLVECSIIATERNDIDFTNLESSKTIISSSEEAMELHIMDKCFKQTPPNKLIRRSILANIRFPEGKLIDDEFWTYRVIGQCRKLVHTDSIMYAYRQQEASVMHRAFSSKRLQAIEAKKERLIYIEANYPSVVSLAKVNLASTCMYLTQMCMKNLEKKEREDVLNEVCLCYKELKLSKSDKKNISGKHRIWFFLADISFLGTCKIRNILKIGF